MASQSPTSASQSSDRTGIPSGGNSNLPPPYANSHEPSAGTDPDALPHAPLPGDEGEESTPSQNPTSSSRVATMSRGTRYAHYDSDAHRLPSGFKRVAYDADTRIYSYRDSQGDLWEGQPGNEYGRLHRVEDNIEAERLESVWSQPMTDEETETLEKPMTVFPDTWDPPDDHETEELPTAKWFQAKSRLGFSTLRKSILRRNRHDQHQQPAPVEKPVPARRSDEFVRNSSVSGWSMTSTLVPEPARPRAKTMAPPPTHHKEWL